MTFAQLLHSSVDTDTLQFPFLASALLEHPDLCLPL